MKDYQLRYIGNLKNILELKDVFRLPQNGFESWYQSCLDASRKISEIKKENDAILKEELFPTLDDIYNASEEELNALEEFSNALLDWKANLDPGVYVIIHEALLRMYRVARNPSRIIKELYLLGMGFYYQDLAYRGSDHAKAHQLNFENEMIFTEASSYFRYFPSLDSDETRGYIIRALANISITSNDRRKRLSSSIKALHIVTDPYYIQMAPSLPWKVYERRTYQQISAVRSTLSRGDFSNEELALIMEACQIIFEPEKGVDNPNIRWLWPYYEMEYNLGLADLKQTLTRMEKLILSTNYDQYDESGLYANVQLPLYYGRLLKNNPQFLEKERYTAFLKDAYEKMMKTLMSLPRENMDEYFSYIFALLANSYFETAGVPTYFDTMKKLISRYTGEYYIKARRFGEILTLYCKTILESDPSFFDELPFLHEMKDRDEKKKALYAYAMDCGLFYDFGLIPMNMDKTLSSRSLFEREDEIYTLHTDIGCSSLKERASTRRFADIALGHHRSYDENDGYPNEYVRLDSPYRRFCDLVCVVSYLEKHYEQDIDAVCVDILSQARTVFSPLIASYLEEEDFRRQIEEILTGERKGYYRELYDQLLTEKENSAS
ncbi:MAG: hypothetical protein IIZ28_05235 [Erysipelotrichaceae bacterium]|nr:hypothetical protein [Erysipelotrichaceae bacterium]